MRTRIFHNPHVSPSPAGAPADRAPLEFHRRLPGYAPTALVDAPGLAAALGVGRVWVKDESRRLGLPAFKILGASWAVYRALCARLGAEPPAWDTLDDLAARLAPLRPLTLAAATDGNHGRAVARMAALLGCSSRIFVPAGTAISRIRAIEGEGAVVTVVNGTYDEAVARSAEQANDRCLVISDTSWPGYEEVPGWVMEGYSTILWEIDDELACQGEKGPDLVAVQVGVGALAAAVARHYRQADRSSQPRLLSVEPLHAACMLASMEAGEIVSVPGPHDSIMAGLNCGRPSIISWPTVSSGFDAFIAISDQRAREAMRQLARAGIVAGETGGSGLAGMIELGPDAVKNRINLGINEKTRVLLFITEGATDPLAYREILGEKGAQALGKRSLLAKSPISARITNGKSIR
jgi:diaminopropionate ammonia-lyase